MKKLFYMAKEPVNSLTHFIGVVFSLFATAVLLGRALTVHAAPERTLSVLLFGVSLFLLYSASTVYHFVRGGEGVTRVLKKIDHSMIFVLIAGTYTPLVVAYFRKPFGYYFLLFLWAFALLGIFLKVFGAKLSRWLSTSMYLLMGWAILFDPVSFVKIPVPVLLLIGAGGVSYSIGGVIYALKKPNFSKTLGFHELFHIFVLIGSFFHFLCVYLFLV